jgi:hypothetical protein
MPKTIPELFEEYVDRQLDIEFNDKINTAGVHRSARRAELMWKLDGFMLTFIKECVSNEDL